MGENAGRFQKGVSGNPGGRPREIGEIRDLARVHTSEAIEALRGIDPAAEKKLRQEAAAAPGDTFKEVAVEFIEKCRRENLAGVTLLKKEWLLDFA